MRASSEIMVTLGDTPPRRLDKALADAVPAGIGLSRSRLRALIEAGAVTGRDGNPVSDASGAPEAGGSYVIRLPEPEEAEPMAEPIALDILYEDADLIVVNKPAGMVVHPAPGAERGTLVNALLHHCGDSLAGIGGTRRPGIVHRIDKDTSGVLVVAKTDRAHQGLSAQFAAHELDRRYVAVVHGVPDAADPRLAGLPAVTFEPGGVMRIDAPIARHPGDRKRMAVRTGGRRAVTRARVAEAFGTVAARLDCWLETGRTHQIRVHMTHVGHALIGDPVYGRGRKLGDAPEFARTFPRQALHAASLGFLHPVTGEKLSFQSDLPADLNELLQHLRNHSQTR